MAERSYGFWNMVDAMTGAPSSGTKKPKKQPSTNYGGPRLGHPSYNTEEAPANFGPVDWRLGALSQFANQVQGARPLDAAVPAGVRGTEKSKAWLRADARRDAKHRVVAPVLRAAGGGTAAPVATGGGGAVIPKNTKTAKGGGGKVRVAPRGPDEIEQMIRAALQQNNRLSDFYGTQNEAIRQATVADALKLSQAAGAETRPIATPDTAGLNAYSADQVTQNAGLVNAANTAQTQGLAELIASRGGSTQGLLGTMRDASNMQRAEYGRSLRQQEPRLRREQQAALADSALKQAQLEVANKQFGIKTQFDYDRLAQQGRVADAQLSQGDRRLSQAERKINQSASKLSKGTSDSAASVKGFINDYLNIGVKTPVPVLDEKGQPMVDPVSGKPITSGTTSTKQPMPRTFDEIISEASAYGLSPQTAARIAVERGKESLKTATFLEIFRSFVPLLGPRQSIALVGRIKGPKAAKFVRNNKQAILNGTLPTSTYTGPTTVGGSVGPSGITG